MTFREKTKDTEMSKKHNTNDIGYGTKVIALGDMGVHNEDFDLLSEEFVNNIIDEVLEEEFGDLEDNIDE
jgi:hypothetical protein|tara:strand:+ start:918 stop:1127 length:210 start_codon:yes stop_codon:yes gene_type:complete